jgi:O-antigen ligase
VLKNLTAEKVLEFLFSSYVFVLAFGHFNVIRYPAIYISFILLGYLVFSKRIEFKNNNFALKVFVFYSIWSIASILINYIDIYQSFKEIKNNLVEQLIIATIVVGYFNTPKKFEKLILILVLSYITLTFLSSIELLFHYFNNDITPILDRGARKVFYFWNGYARVSAIYFPIMIGYFIYKRKFLLGGFISLISFILVLLYASSSIIVFLILVTLFIFILKFYNRKRIIFTIGLLIIGVSFTADKFLLYSSIENKIFDLKKYDLTDPHALSGRGYIWRGVLMSLNEPKNILFGYGYGWKKMELVMKKNKISEKNEALKNPHNTYFEILFTTGIIGLLSILLIAGKSLIYALKSNLILIKYVVAPVILSFLLNSITNGYWEGTSGKVMIILFVAPFIFYRTQYESKNNFPSS